MVSCGSLYFGGAKAVLNAFRDVEDVYNDLDDSLKNGKFLNGGIIAGSGLDPQLPIGIEKLSSLSEDNNVSFEELEKITQNYYGFSEGDAEIVINSVYSDKDGDGLSDFAELFITDESDWEIADTWETDMDGNISVAVEGQEFFFEPVSFD